MMLAFDVETTGFDADTDQIIELGVANDQGDKTSWLVRVQRSIPEEVVELTGITDQMIADEGLPWRQVWAEAGPMFVEADIVVAYNAAFDRGFLRAYQHRQPAEPRIGLDGRMLDPYLLSQRYFPDGTFDDRRLSTVAEHFGVSLTRAHRAGDDALATLEVLERMCEAIHVSPDDLIDEESFVLGAPMRHLDPFEALVRGLGPTQRGRYHY